VLAAGAMTASTVAAAALVSRQQAPPDPSEAVFVRLCTSCHSADSTINMGRQPRAVWRAVIDEMVMEGMVGADEDVALAEDYLLRQYGKVNVNKDAAEEISLVLAVPRTQADDIVKYRNAHGPFRTIEALAEVPGLGLKRLQQLKDAIAF
jgi:competence ComEA-like helix-hairpin-helix protein